MDVDCDGGGEPGWLGELSGAEDVRDTAMTLAKEPFVSMIFGVKDAAGLAQKSGYHYRLFLRDADGRWIAEPEKLEGAARPAGSQQWLCYAWPSSAGRSGNRTFVVTEEGVVRSIGYENIEGVGGPYSGASRTPLAEAALAESGDAIDLESGSVHGRDGRLWKRVDR